MIRVFRVFNDILLIVFLINTFLIYGKNKEEVRLIILTDHRRECGKRKKD